MRIALLPRFNRERQPILLRRQGAGRIGGVGAGRVVQLVEIEHERSRLLDTVAGQPCTEKPRGLVSGGPGGAVAQNEEQLVALAALEHRLQAQGLAIQGEFGNPGSGHIERGVDNRRDLFGARG